MQEHLQKLMSAHAALSLEVKSLGDRLVDALALVEGMGHQINLLSTLAEAPSDKPTPVLCFNWRDVQWPPIPIKSRVRLDHGEFYTKTGIVTEDFGPYCKIDVDGKSTELGKRWLSVLGAPPIAEMSVHAPSEIPPAHVAEFAPDYEPHSSPERADFETEAAEDAKAFAAESLDKPLPHLGGRKKTEYTAREWAYSGHFLAYMKKAPFKNWPASEQVDKRDAFVAAMPPDLRMNRWGERFSKFCGVL